MTKTIIIHWGWWRKKISFSLGISPPWYTLHLWPFTRKHSPLEFISSSAPWEKTCCTLNGPLHLDLNLPGNNFSLELNKRTRSPTLNSFLRIWASCHHFFSPWRAWYSHMLEIETHPIHLAVINVFHRLLLCRNSVLWWLNKRGVQAPPVNDKLFQKLIGKETCQ